MDNHEKTPLTTAERTNRYRAKRLATDPSFQAKESKRVEQARKRRVDLMTPDEKDMYRQKARERKEKSRQKNARDKSASATASTACTEASFKSPQAYGKAMSKTSRHLPKSPRRRKLIIAGLAKRHGLALAHKMNRELDNGAVFGGLPSETVNLITQFYLRSDIVYTSPNMKDVITVTEKGEKERKQKCYLTLYLREVYELFKIENPDVSVSFSKFCKLRPKHVVLLKNTPADQCKCQVHENFRLRLAGLNINYTGAWWKSVLCLPENFNSACWKNECETCKNGKLIHDDIDISVTDETRWFEWEKNESGQFEKVLKSGSARELLECIISSVPNVKEHVRIKHIQSEDFEKCKSESRVLQVDFAMSYSCEYQDEIQCALWSRKSVSLFTGALFHGDKCQTYVISSDCSDKGKDSVITYLFKLYDEILNHNEMMSNVIFSDGPSTEFKNKFTMNILYHLGERYKCDFEWHYFAKSHGKGVVDGVGGTIKSAVRTRVMSKDEKTIVQNSTDFHNVASSILKSTKCFHISKNEIDELNKMLNPWDNTVQVPGIRGIHVVKYHYGSKTIMCWKTSYDVHKKPFYEMSFAPTLNGDDDDDDEHHEVSCSQGGIKTPLSVGQWCLVNYEGAIFPGEVTQSVGNETEVSVMTKSGTKYWKWPEKEDKVFYSESNIMKLIDPPHSSRTQRAHLNLTAPSKKMTM